jgi:O-methyltransferase
MSGMPLYDLLPKKFGSATYGLCYFFPRLEKGGYIFIHDYNAMIYSGAKVAVRKFAAEYNVPFFPLNDNCGSVIIMK